MMREVDSGIAELVPDPDVSDAWTLCLNGTPQSHVDLEDPTRLEFEYVRRLAHVADLAAPPGAPLRVMHLGGGALTLPRYIATTRPRSAQQAVEIDAALIDLVLARLPLDRAWRVRIRHGDARAVLAEAPEGVFDLVVTDVFAGARTPAHLTSVEYVSLAARALGPAGVYAANIADGGELAFARAQVATAGGVPARLRRRRARRVPGKALRQLHPGRLFRGTAPARPHPPHRRRPVPRPRRAWRCVDPLHRRHPAHHGRDRHTLTTTARGHLRPDRLTA